MPNAKDLEQSRNVLALFVGKSGTRKSTVAASFPGPKYMFDFDGRIASLRGVDIEYDTYTRVAGWGKCERKLDELLDAAKIGKPKYRTIIFSSITTMLDFFLWEAKEHYGKNPESGFRIIRPNSTKSILMSDMPHFKFVHAALSDLINNYIKPMSLVYNIIVEAHEVTLYDKEGNPEGERVLASDSLAEKLPTEFNETWHFKYKKSGNPESDGTWTVYFRNTALAKTTFKQLPNYVVINDKEATFYDNVFLKLLAQN